MELKRKQRIRQTENPSNKYQQLLGCLGGTIQDGVISSFLNDRVSEVDSLESKFH